MSDLTAIDILVNPTDDAIDHARQINARMRRSVPEGFALDDTHQPHITTLQRYVLTQDLDSVYDAVHHVIGTTDMATLSYQAVEIGHADWGVPGQGLAAIVLQPSAQVLDFQAALLKGITPFVGSGGSATAFVTDHDNTDISQSTRDWVEHYVPNQFGAGHYIAHITVGFATLDDLKKIEAEAFDAFTVRPASLSVYQLGNSGTARRELKRWPISS